MKWKAVLSPADEGTPAAAAAPAAPPSQPGSFFSGSATAEGGTAGTPPAAAGEGDGSTPPAQARPDWLIGKYATVEDQAKGYSELYRSYSKKTDDLRAQIKEEAIAEYGKTVGVPETEDGYSYPEGFQAPDEPVDKALREWARKNNVSPEGFKTL
ncbi:MAG TPA: hypothetical protein VN755_12590, partial [Steroidobacteraceae bacterium]|nr:hypothetical protein [Steroidobacteraceae bacterium]